MPGDWLDFLDDPGMEHPLCVATPWNKIRADFLFLSGWSTLVPLHFGTLEFLSSDHGGLWADRLLMCLISGNPDFQAVSGLP